MPRLARAAMLLIAVNVPACAPPPVTTPAIPGTHVFFDGQELHFVRLCTRTNKDACTQGAPGDLVVCNEPGYVDPNDRFIMIAIHGGDLAVYKGRAEWIAGKSATGKAVGSITGFQPTRGVTFDLTLSDETTGQRHHAYGTIRCP